jgi:hypothetical protein
MDTTTRIISQKKVNTDTATGLDRYSQITSLNIDGDNNGLITVKGRIALLSSTGVCMLVENKWEYTRYDKPATFADQKVIDTPAEYYALGEDMGGGILAESEDIVKVAEVSHYEQVQVTPANNKYAALEQNPLGQGIKQMLGIDLEAAIVNGVWTPANLNQL